MRDSKGGKTRTKRAWKLKETFLAFYQCENCAQATDLLKEWCLNAMRSKFEAVKKVARMLQVL